VRPAGPALRAFANRRPTDTDERLLDTLRAIKKKYGALSTNIVRGAKAGPSFNAYCARFGSIARAFELVGYSPNATADFTAKTCAVPKAAECAARFKVRFDARPEETIAQARREAAEAIIEKSRGVPSCTLYRRRFGSRSHVYNLIGYRPRWQEQRPRPQVSV
jgi:hypothetical protein